MKMYHYILNDDKTIEKILVYENGKCIDENMSKWADNFWDTENRRLGYDEIGNKIVSTIFLGIDPNFLDTGKPPILFETAISIDDEWDIVERYRSYDDAMEGHKKWIKKTSSQS